MAVVMLGVVVAFLYLGGLLHLFAQQAGLAARGDRLFPAVVMGYLPAAVQLVFVVVDPALFPSADGALHRADRLTCMDLLGGRAAAAMPLAGTGARGEPARTIG